MLSRIDLTTAFRYHSEVIQEPKENHSASLIAEKYAAQTMDQERFRVGRARV